MARIRSIKPDFFHDELIASWPHVSRLAYIGLWVEADDEGRLRASSSYLRTRLFPYDNRINMERVLQPIVNAGRLVLYAVDGQTYGQLPKFEKHQYINRPKKSKLPTIHGSSSDDSGDDHGSSSAGMEGNGREWKGGEGNGEGKPPPTTTALMELWNTKANGSLARCRGVQGQRADRAKARLKEQPELAWWAEVLERINASRFCRGETPPGDGHSKRFKADFDWLVRPGNAHKVLEGKYDDEAPGGSRCRVPTDEELADWTPA